MTDVERKLILPPAEFEDDEQLLEWLEVCRKITLKAADELDEDSAHIYAVIRRYLRNQHGMRGWPANRTARAVALPISRAADSFESSAGYFRVGSRAVEAMVEATEPRARRKDDFKIRSRD